MSEVFPQEGSVSILINRAFKEVITHIGRRKC